MMMNYDDGRFELKTNDCFDIAFMNIPLRFAFP